MAVKVVDASALAALLFGEPEADAVAEQLGDARLVAPALLGFELANICLIKAGRHPEQRTALTAAFQLRDQFAVEEVAVDHDGALELAATTSLTAYDASYGMELERTPRVVSRNSVFSDGAGDIGLAEVVAFE